MLPGKCLILPVAILMVGIALSVWLYRAVGANEERLLRQSVEVQSRNLGFEIEQHVDGLIRALERMADRWAAAGGTPRDQFEADARLYTADIRGIQTVVWVDGESRVRWAAPREAAGLTLGARLLDDPALRTNIVRAGERRHTVVATSSNVATGTPLVLVITPLIIGDRSDGLLITVLRVPTLLDFLFDKIAGDVGVRIHVGDAAAPIVYERGSIDPALPSSAVNIRLRDAALYAEVGASPELLSRALSPLRTALLVAGLVLSGSVAAMTYLLIWLGETRQRVTASEARFQDLYDHAPDMYAVVAADTGRVTSCNRRLLDATGFTDDEVIGQPVWALYVDEQQAVAQSSFAQFVASGRLSNQERKLRTIDGQHIDVSLSASAIYDADGKVSASRTQWRDIGELVRAREAERYARRLESQTQRLEEFAYVASHELQGPLRTIRSFGTLLSRRFSNRLGEDGAKYIEHIRAASGRLQELISALLEYARLGIDEGSFGSVQLDDVLPEIIADLDATISQHGAEIELGRLPVVTGERALLRQVFQNLLVNAMKYRHPDRSPRVRIYEQGVDNPGSELTSIAIEDNGIGFEADEAERIFRLFTRLHGQNEYEGVGIGLATCRRILEYHRGTVRARGVLGQGATFVITLPRHQPSAAPHDTAMPPAPRASRA